MHELHAATRRVEIAALGERLSALRLCDAEALSAVLGLIHSRGRVGSVDVTASGACDVAPVWVELAAPAAFGRPPTRPRIGEWPRTAPCRPRARGAGGRRVAARRIGLQPASPSGLWVAYPP